MLIADLETWRAACGWGLFRLLRSPASSRDSIGFIVNHPDGERKRNIEVFVPSRGGPTGSASTSAPAPAARLCRDRRGPHACPLSSPTRREGRSSGTPDR